MLDKFRRTQHNFIYTILLLATVAVMAFYGVGQMNKQGGGGAAAWVNGEAVPAREYAQELEYQKEYFRNRMGAQYDEKLLDMFQIPQRTLDELVQSKLLAQQAKKLDFQVPDAELVDHIKSIPYFQKDGVFDAALYTSLPNRGLEEQRERERLLVARMQGYLVDRVKVTPQQLHDQFLLNDTKVDLDYAKIDFNELASQQKPSPAALQDFLKKTPESELRGYYESHRNEFVQRAAINLRQIRIGIPFQAKAAVKAEAHKKIDAVAKQVTPDNFGALAHKYSDDEYAKKGGQVGWVTRGTLEHPLEQAIDKLEVGKVSGPVETPFGYYVLKVEGKRPESSKPFDEVKKQIAQTLLIDRTKREFTDKTKSALEKTLADGKPLDADLKRFKIEVKKTGPFSLAQGVIPNVGQADSLVDSVAGLTRENPSVKHLVFHQGYYYYLRLRSVEPAKPAEFAKNSEPLEKSLSTSAESAVLSKWMENLRKASTINLEIQFQSKGMPLAAGERS